MSQLKEKIANLSDEELIVMVKVKAEEYNQKYINFAREEFNKRNFSKEKIKEAIENNQKPNKKADNGNIINDFKKDNLLNFKLKLSEEKLKKEIDNYQKVGYNNKARAAGIFLLVLASIKAIFMISTSYPISIMDLFFAIVLAYFVYRGKKWALITTMIFWTLNMGSQIVFSFATTNFEADKVIIQILFWPILMKPLFQAYQVERERSKRYKVKK